MANKKLPIVKWLRDGIELRGQFSYVDILTLAKEIRWRFGVFNIKYPELKAAIQHAIRN